MSSRNNRKMYPANRKNTPFNSVYALTAKKFYANMGGRRRNSVSKGGIRERSDHPLNGIWNLGRSEPFTGIPSFNNNNPVVESVDTAERNPQVHNAEQRKGLTKRAKGDTLPLGGNTSKGHRMCPRTKRGDFCGVCYERAKGR